MSSRGPRLLIPSGLLGVALTTLAVLARSAPDYPGQTRAIIVGAITIIVADGVHAFRALRRLDAEMATPAAVTAGARFDARARILGVTRPATVDPLFPDSEPTHFDGPEPFLLTCHATQRGVFNHLLVEVRCRSPLGLWASARRVAVMLPDTLWVAPAPRPGPPPTSAEAPRRSGTHRVAVAREVDGMVRAARPYQPGDSARLVHWPATAHEGRLMVRETETDRDALPALVVDLHGPGEAAEEALGRAASTASEALARDGRVRLVTAEPVATGTRSPIPRAVLVPAATLRAGAPPSGPTTTVDRIETTAEGIHRRLAGAATAPVDRTGLPAGAWTITEMVETDGSVETVDGPDGSGPR